jgi:alcohol dehydrogenase
MQGVFSFLPVERIYFGENSLDSISEELKRLGVNRALIITGNSIANRTGVLKKVLEQLGNFPVDVFAGIRQHTPASDVERAYRQAVAFKADVLISLGGGSPIDAAKAVARMYLENQNYNIPQIAIPTTLSAAEFSHLVGVTNEEKKLKSGFADDRVTPRCVILDPVLTLETPMDLWLATGIRALDHAVETLYSPGYHPVNDVLALECIKKLFKYLPLCKENPPDVNARHELMLGTWMGFFAENNVEMGLSHKLGRRIGASFDVAHGVTSCIALSHVMRYLVPSQTTPLASIAEVLELAAGKTQLEAAYAASEAVAGLVSNLGLPNRLSQVGIGEQNFPELLVFLEMMGVERSVALELLRAML